MVGSHSWLGRPHSWPLSDPDSERFCHFSFNQVVEFVASPIHLSIFHWHPVIHGDKHTFWHLNGPCKGKDLEPSCRWHLVDGLRSQEKWNLFNRHPPGKAPLLRWCKERRRISSVNIHRIHDIGDCVS